MAYWERPTTPVYPSAIEPLKQRWEEISWLIGFALSEEPYIDPVKNEQRLQTWQQIRRRVNEWFTNIVFEHDARKSADKIEDVVEKLEEQYRLKYAALLENALLRSVFEPSVLRGAT